MNIVICTIPLRDTPSSMPPFGSIVLIQSLRKADYDPYFYDIDAWRPSFEEAVHFILDQSPDVVGISAVVSTGYTYTKRLALAIKEASPHTKIVVGGNLAASAEILLRFCKVDVCAIGEGEHTIVSLARYWEENRVTDDISALRKIKGISYLDDGDGEMKFTGYVDTIPAAEFLDPDYAVVEQFSKIGNFLKDPLKRYDFSTDPRSYEPHRRGKLQACVQSAKGCVARCTFCHRWDKGYRHWPVDKIMANIEHLMDRYNVGFFTFADENFGSDRKKLDQLIEQIKDLDILYKVSGVRVRSVDPDVLGRLKESGCVGMYYGMESGSPEILESMEKNANLEQNVNAARWTYEAGIHTVYQMVLAMPGETHETIAETSDFLKEITEFLPEPPSKRLSINYIQALPGTPVYEYARNTGLIGKSLEEEEEYLINISNINAVDDRKFLNFTKYDYLTVQSWRPKIIFDSEANWYKTRGWKAALNRPEATRLGTQLPDFEAEENEDDDSRTGYFNMGHTFFIRHPLFYRLLSSPLGYPLRVIYPALFLLAKDVKRMPKRQLMWYLGEYLWRKVKKRPGLKDLRSLRKVMNERTPIAVTSSEENMEPLRLGR